jgi:hypothetical protein
MSDTTPIQSTPTPEQGAQTPLSPDASAGRTRGTDQDQNTMSFSRGTEVPASSADVASRNNLNNGAAVTGVQVSVAQTSHRALEGSNAPNDFRKSGDVAAASLAAVSGSSKCPRDPVQQAPNGRNAR